MATDPGLRLAELRGGLGKAASQDNFLEDAEFIEVDVIDLVGSHCCIN